MTPPIYISNKVYGRCTLTTRMGGAATTRRYNLLTSRRSALASGKARVTAQAPIQTPVAASGIPSKAPVPPVQRDIALDDTVVLPLKIMRDIVWFRDQTHNYGD